MYPALAILFLLLSPIMRDDVDKDILKERLTARAHQLKAYATLNDANTDVAILCDMSIASNMKRLFVIDLHTDSILLSGLVGQGQGNDAQREEIVFSNKPNSLCSSEGRYKVGAKFYGQWGLSYRLHGLDSTNCNAFARAIVIHAHKKMADEEGGNACRSYGCPMVSANVLAGLSKIFDSSEKPVLMWIYK